MGCGMFEDEGYKIHCKKISPFMSFEPGAIDTLKDIRTCPNERFCSCSFRQDKNKEMALNNGKPIKFVGFMCGPGIKPCRYCGNVADFLCDYPIGKGKTCDIPVCEGHATEIGDDLHLCQVHNILENKEPK